MSVEVLLRSPLVAARPVGEHWDASAALGVLAAAGAAMRPHGCDPVVWRPQRRSMWLRASDPARNIDTWLGSPATGTGVLWAAWHRRGQVLTWSDDPADNGPVRHFMTVHYTLGSVFKGEHGPELERWCRAMGPQLEALDGWVRDPERGTCRPWRPVHGTPVAMPAPGARPG